MPFQGDSQSETAPKNKGQSLPRAPERISAQPSTSKEVKIFHVNVPFQEEGGASGFPATHVLSACSWLFSTSWWTVHPPHLKIKYSFSLGGFFVFCVTCWLIFAFKKQKNRKRIWGGHSKKKEQLYKSSSQLCGTVGNRP